MRLLNLPVYQQGGAVTPPYMVYQPIPTASTAARYQAAQTQTQSSRKDLTDKDLLEMLAKMDGLPNDMAAITRQLQNFYLDQSPGSTGADTDLDTSNIAMRYLNILQQARVMHFNKEQYDEAFKQVSDNGGIHEYAIDSRGRFFCNNEEGDYRFMSPEELRKDKDGYHPLTNSELLYLRAHSMDLVNNNIPLSVVQNGIGMETVNKYISDAIAGLGTQETSQEGYLSVRKGRLLNGIEDYMKAVQEASGKDFNGSISDLYKSKYLTKDQAQRAQQALEYIYQTLPANAKSLLKSRSDLSDTGAVQLVGKLVSSKLDSTVQLDLDWYTEDEDGTLKKNNTGKKTTRTTKTKDELTTGFVTNVVLGIGGVEQKYMKIDKGDGVAIEFTGKSYGTVETPEGKPISYVSMEDMLNSSGLMNIIDNASNIMFGDQRLSKEDLAKIAYTSGGIHTAILPKNPDGSVDLEIRDRFVKAEKEIEELGDKPDQNKVIEILNKYSMTGYLNTDGTVNTERCGRFMLTEGYTTDGLTAVHESDFVRECRDIDRAYEDIKRCLSYKIGSKDRSPEIDSPSIWPADWFGLWDKPYHAVLYIPIDNDVVNAVEADNNELSMGRAMELTGNRQRFDTRELVGYDPEDNILKITE